jgi:hypothetical protein
VKKCGVTGFCRPLVKRSVSCDAYHESVKGSVHLFYTLFIKIRLAAASISPPHGGLHCNLILFREQTTLFGDTGRLPQALGLAVWRTRPRCKRCANSHGLGLPVRGGNPARPRCESNLLLAEFVAARVPLVNNSFRSGIPCGPIGVKSSLTFRLAHFNSLEA